MSFLNAEVTWTTGAGMPNWCTRLDHADQVDPVDPESDPEA
jgi:hypothetical protein